MALASIDSYDFPKFTSRPDLGQNVPVGTLYDMRTDKFLTGSLFKEPPRIHYPSHQKDPELLRSTSRLTGAHPYTRKCAIARINTQLAGSILSGLVNVGDGSARVFNHRHTSTTEPTTTLHYEVHITRERLGPGLDLDHLVDLTAQASDAMPTHYAWRVHWGARCVVQVDDCEGWDEERLHNVLLGISNETLGEAASLRMYSDLSAKAPNSGPFKVSLEDAQRHLRDFLKNAKKLNGGKGIPIYYDIAPIDDNWYPSIQQYKSPILTQCPDKPTLDQLLGLRDTMCTAFERLQSLATLYENHTTLIPRQHVDEVYSRLEEMEIVMDDGMDQLRETIVAVRSGTAAHEDLHNILHEIRAKISSFDSCSEATYGEKISFVEKMVRDGVVYQGFTPATLEQLHEDVYTLHFSNDHLDSDSSDSGLWAQTVCYFQQLLQDTTKPKTMILLDLDAHYDEGEKRPRISHSRQHRVVTEDLLRDEKIKASKPVLCYRISAVDSGQSDKEKPIQRRPVRLPCPNKGCDHSNPRDWVCNTCESIVEHGHVDDRLYCDCGGSSYRKWQFQCDHTAQGPIHISINENTLREQLMALPPIQEFNILILGETGVGKSTWINAFANYLTFDSLEDGIKARDLRWIIPCSFNTQTIDADGRFEQKEIRIGKSDTEIDGTSGQSATQKTSAYTILIGDYRVRLIDTPGIGDTRGINQDNRNMEDILQILTNYNQLHGILILLKPNSARLTVMFRFCINELLTQLDKSAANNIIFGFTNTRGANYRPGDTHMPLQTLLKEYDNVEIELRRQNVFCFDSESFRYLAAKKQGVDMGQEQDNIHSWNHSVEECRRLIQHIKSLAPHNVRNTLSLNESRNMICMLTEPMAKISQSINASIAINQDEIEMLQSTELSLEESKKALNVQRISLVSYLLDYPRTVCAHTDCVSIRNDIEGCDESVIVYKQVCHERCYLENIVIRNHKGHEGLVSCGAIDRTTGFCRHCSHSYMDHMHIYYDYRSEMRSFIDTAVSEKMKRSQDAAQVQREAIRSRRQRIMEMQQEHDAIQSAAVQFGFFLKENAFVPYNDATLEYIDHLIDQEKIKISHGGSAKGLEGLRNSKAKYTQQVETLRIALANGSSSAKVLDTAGIQDLFKDLFHLQHFGAEMKEIFDNNQKFAERTFREKTYSISVGGYWHHNHTGGPSSKRTGGTRSLIRKSHARQQAHDGGRVPFRPPTHKMKHKHSVTPSETESQDHEKGSESWALGVFRAAKRKLGF